NMSHELGRTNSLPWLPFSIINLIKFQKTNLKDEGEISTSNSAIIIANLCRASRGDFSCVEMTNFTITLLNVADFANCTNNKNSTKMDLYNLYGEI
ncbi:hypothetical protein SD960_18380, partial [Flavobacterium sp. MMLR14_040]|uniref:hypothetical protein n=1 Tax=Flavobacterium sp. MMLR14_040 TaxID=3093843 RepID=UPI00298FD1FD